MTRFALEECRTGNGPILIEAYTYRMSAHTSNDDPTRYRLAAEVEEWTLRDPIERVKAYLVRNGHVDQQFFDDIEAESDEIAARLRAGTLAMEPPALEEMFDWAYAEQTDLLATQRKDFVDYKSSFVGEEA